MTKLKLLSAGLIAAAMLTTPVMAREHHLNARHVAKDTDASATLAARYIDGHLCDPAPRVGAFATQSWDNDTPCEPKPGYWSVRVALGFLTRTCRAGRNILPARLLLRRSLQVTKLSTHMKLYLIDFIHLRSHLNDDKRCWRPQ
jgi:hypothetical protein